MAPTDSWSTFPSYSPHTLKKQLAFAVTCGENNNVRLVMPQLTPTTWNTSHITLTCSNSEPVGPCVSIPSAYVDFGVPTVSCFPFSFPCFHPCGEDWKLRRNYEITCYWNSQNSFPTNHRFSSILHELQDSNNKNWIEIKNMSKMIMFP